MGESGSYSENFLRLAFRYWVIGTGVFLIGNGALYIWKGGNGFYGFFREIDSPIAPLTFASVAVVWLSLGLALALLCNRDMRTAHGISIICTLLVVLLYTNILRERTSYGDVGDYIHAAENLSNHEPFQNRYLYPPLFATILTPLLPLGRNMVADICWLVNLASLALFSVCFTTLLARYGFSRQLSALLTLGFLAINVPVLRTLGYGQVNLHLANLITLTLLFYPRFPFLSALSLALAVHLKISPIVLVLPFLLRRDWRWTIWFAIAMSGLVGLTVLPYGWRPFVDSFHNLENIYTANNICFRENSVDCLFRSIAWLVGVPFGGLSWLVYISKLAILVMVVLTMIRVIKNEIFSQDDHLDRVVYNGVPVLMLLMMLWSPLIWEHHPVFIALPFLLMLKRLAKPAEWVIFSFAFFLEYLLPTFDFFPWSFGRLLSPLVLIGLIYTTSKRKEDGSLQQWIDTARHFFFHNAEPSA